MLKKRKVKKISTIDGLARLMQEEFLSVHGEFSNVYKRMDTEFVNVHKRMDAEFTNVHKRIDTLEGDIRDIKESSSELFTKLDEFISLYRETKQELTLLARQFRRLEARIVQLESRR
jgi:chromosome segregation ATPase